MDQVFPDPISGVDAAAIYRNDRRTGRGRRPWVVVNMVATIDGAVTIDGHSGALSSPADKAIFFALRSIADVILVGAGTVRAENYGPARIPPEQQTARRQRGQEPVPPIAVVSGRLQLDPTARVFAGTPARPIILTTEHADEDRGAALEEVADILPAGTTVFDPELALDRLHRRGADVVLCEGGPTLNGALLAAGLVDELCLTVAPLLVGGEDPRVTRGVVSEPARPVDLDRILIEDGFLFLRSLVRH